MQDGESELEQVEQELAATGGSKRSLTGSDDGKKPPTAGGFPGLSSLSPLLGLLFSQVFLKAFTLTFLAEWGDRSQIATIGCALQPSLHRCVVPLWHHVSEPSPPAPLPPLPSTLTDTL